MASENIFAGMIQPIKSVEDWQAERDARALRQAQLQGAQRQNALADLVAQQQRQTMSDTAADRNALSALAAGWNADTTADQRIAGLRNSGRAGLISQADAMEKAHLERKKAEAAAGKDGAETLAKQLDALKFLSQSVMASPTPQNAALAVDAFERLTGRQMPEERQRLAQLQTPEQVRQWAAGHALKADDLIPKLQMFNTGKQQVPVDMNPMTNPNPQALTMTTTPGEDLSAQTSRANNAATVGATIRGQNLVDARTREKIAVDRDAIGKVDWKQDADGNWVGLPKDVKNGPVTPVKTTGEGKREIQARHALDVVNEARGLIDQGTSSYLGAGIDQAARVFGKSTDGAQAGAKLKALEGALMMSQPRMEGPQSDKDVALYRQMAGQIGDPTVPADTKRAALDAIEQLHKKYTKGASTTAAKPSVSNW